ncbi:HAD family hydrolase [uncultured Gammaproteobacteria bacterium]
MPTPLTGLAPVAGRYRGYIIDLWGVVHDGVHAYSGVVECLTRLRADGARICLLSNVPRRARLIEQVLARMGIPRSAYDHLVTSGETVVEALRHPPDDWHRQLGRRYLHLGPNDDRDDFGALEGLIEVGAPDQADFILLRDPDTFDSVLDDYRERLQTCAERGLPMVCANPDHWAMVGGKRVMCAGLLAAHYQSLGGEVRYHGKPFASVYRRCLELIGTDDPTTVLAIGDSLHTDIAGANAAGLASVLVPSGVHGTELGCVWGELPDRVRLAQTIAATGHRPAAVLARLAW